MPLLRSVQAVVSVGMSSLSPASRPQDASVEVEVEVMVSPHTEETTVAEDPSSPHPDEEGERGVDVVQPVKTPLLMQLLGSSSGGTLSLSFPHPCPPWDGVSLGSPPLSW